MNLYLKNVISLITLFSFLFYSCHMVIRKSDTFNIKKMYDDINSYAEGNKVQVLMINNNFYSGYNFDMDDESASLIDIQQNKINIKTSEIHQIIIKNKISSTVIGVFSGASIFAFISYLSGIPVSGGHPNMGMLLYIPALIGSGVIGGFIGSLQNNDKIFIINE